VKDALFQILERGRPIRGFLGVQMRDLDPGVRSALQYDGEMGTAVMGITPGSPAQTAGLKTWDVVQKFNGQTIRDANQLLSLVQATRVGETIPIVIWRKGETLELNAKIAESGSESPATNKPAGTLNRDPEEILQAMGIEVRDLSVPERMRGFRGVVVTGLAPAGIAEEFLQAGDLIVAVNNSRVTGASEFFLHLAASASVQDTTLIVVRDGQSTRVTLPALRGQ